jgi:adenosine deaminase
LRRKHWTFTFVFLITSLLAAAQSNRPASAEARTARYLETIRNQPSLLVDFIRQLPKGGDLHNHLSGAVYAESYVRFAAEDGLCVDRKTMALLQPSHPAAASDGAGACDPGQGQTPASQALRDPVLYRDLVDAWSMRNFSANGESPHDHFFDTFLKFDAATRRHVGEMLAEVVSRAAHGRVIYLELILAPDNLDPAARLGASVGWNGDPAATRQKLLESGIARVVANARQALDTAAEEMRRQLACGSPQADSGCDVVVRYQYEVHRGLPPEQVYAEMVAGFELAAADPRVVAVNLVMPEDAYIPMRDFRLHMRMLDYLHGLYPAVHISPHAGELAPKLVPPEGLRFHIRESIERGHAERIGHGDDVMYEHHPIALLREMARRNILVEICLTSNDLVLGVRGYVHPLPMYLRYGVPVAIATDDEGVARSDIVQEYLRAEQTYGFSYETLKDMARASLEHAFLPGQSLWADGKRFRRQPACQGDKPAKPPTGACAKLLASSEKARLQWRLEGEFGAFEEKMAARVAERPVGR